MSAVPKFLGKLFTGRLWRKPKVLTWTPPEEEAKVEEKKKETVPAAPQAVQKDVNDGVLAGAEAAQRIRRNAIAQRQRRPAVQGSSAARLPSLIGG